MLLHLNRTPTSIGNSKKLESSVKTAGQFLTHTSQLKMMLEVVVPAVIAMITGGGVLFTRVHNRIHDIDRRVDGVELRMAESYVSKNDFNSAVNRMESHLVRIEEKLDAVVASK